MGAQYVADSTESKSSSGSHAATLRPDTDHAFRSSCGSLVKTFGENFPIQLNETETYERQRQVAAYTFVQPLFVYIGGGICAFIQILGLFFAFGTKNVRVQITGLRVRPPHPSAPAAAFEVALALVVPFVFPKVVMYLNSAVVPFLAFVIYLTLYAFNAFYNGLGFVLLPCVVHYFDACRTAMVSDIWPVKKNAQTAVQRYIAVALRLGPVVLSSVFTIGLAMSMISYEFRLVGLILMVVSG
eukprot:7383318-Prymnesium_polylepis.3